MLLCALGLLTRHRRPLQDTHPRVNDVPVNEAADNVAHIALGVIVARTAVQHAQIVEGQHVTWHRFKGDRLLMSHAYECGIGLIPWHHLIDIDAEVAVTLGHAVIDARIFASCIKAITTKRYRYTNKPENCLISRRCTRK